MPFIDHRPWFSYRGLPTHQIMPMLGVHHRVQWMIAVARPTDPGRYVLNNWYKKHGI
jgi:hypothetical protein